MSRHGICGATLQTHGLEGVYIVSEALPTVRDKRYMVNLLLAVIYAAFISLGLPYSVLGAAWPTIYTDFGVPLSYAGIVSMIVSAGTIVSSLMSDTLTFRLGTGKLTALSVAATALALFGFSISSSFWMLCLWAIPYGLGAGSVDASLNNYVALNYASRHMSWLHCMWGVGASLGPMILSLALTGGQGWYMGYRYIALIQTGLTLVLMFSLPLWKKRPGSDDSGTPVRPMSLREIVAVPGAKAVMLAFFSYCALEQTCGLWASSYMLLSRGVAEEAAAGMGSLYFIGITAGRAINGFLTFKFSDSALIRLGSGVILLGALLMLLPFQAAAVLGLVLAGLGSGPVYPCIIHSTPEHFGAERSQALIGVQMASAYTGTCLMPPLFGLIANRIDTGFFPFFLLFFLAVSFISIERLGRVCKG